MDSHNARVWAKASVSDSLIKNLSGHYDDKDYDDNVVVFVVFVFVFVKRIIVARQLLSPLRSQSCIFL